MEYILLISVLISFVLAVSFLPMWIRVCRRINLTWEDIQKEAEELGSYSAVFVKRKDPNGDIANEELMDWIVWEKFYRMLLLEAAKMVIEHEKTKNSS